jgi:signal peptidase I
MDGSPAEAAHSTKSDLAAEVLRSSGTLRLRVSGSSMLPSIWPGDVLVIRRREIGQVRPGETAFISSHGRLVAHRVKAVQGAAAKEYLITQGDTVPSPDPPVTAENLLGVVVTIERHGRSFAPRLRPGLAARVTAAVLRRSSRASKILQRAYALRCRTFSVLPPLPEQL